MENEFAAYKNLPLEAADAIRAAQKSLPKEPVDIVGLAEKFGLEVFKAEMPPNISGTILKQDSGYAIYSNKKEPWVRRRFTYAHELAHFLLHKESIGDGIKENILFRSPLSNEKEVEANRLAADILMPMSVLHKEADKEELGVEGLAKTFGVSRSAMLIRLGIPL